MKNKVRNYLAWLISLAFIVLGFIKRSRKKAQNGEYILSIYFHNPSKKLFEFCVTWLLKNNFSFLTQQDLLAISTNQKEFPKGGVIITVDDGWQSNEENIVAIANKYKLPVTIFITTEPVQNGNYWWPYVDFAEKNNIGDFTVQHLKTVPNKTRELALKKIKESVSLPREAMTIEQVKSISKSEFLTIGGHTLTHPILPNCDDEQSFEELKASKIIIEEWIGHSINSFAYPNGDYGTREIEYLKKLDYKIAYTTKPLPLTKEALSQIYELPRFGVFENVSNLEAICRMVGVWQRFFKS
ncbi:polysaccharide deacetylase family protein [Pedobacter sp. SD-b]|uniref:Polysaccharide deacetylase family protein n=1 Tax=Pedobacter segetis TaxID=2793069 RepID=A0ABS1BFT1_9SPHI|nr:polysaccharide deacetylase family protein [Pedobacter segetis]MBK0381651.1 polysaccharide deacetylase family protein [Pedobacter segetis]